MTYLESAEDLTITQERALQELDKHGMNSRANYQEFFNDMGKAKTYDAYAVLEWLGY